MARFCTSCGAPAASDQVKFCGKCGKPLPAPAAAAPAGPATPPSAPTAQAPPPAPVQPIAAVAAPAAAPAAAATSSGPWVKIIVGVLGFFALVSVLAIGTCAYIGYRAKKRFDTAKAQYGLDKLGGVPSPGSASVQGRDVCSLVSKEEVSAILGVTVTEATGSTENCTYASAQNPSVAEDRVTWQGGALAYKMGVGTMKYLTAGAPIMTPVAGIGDEAVTMSPMQGQAKEDFQRDMQKDQSGFLKGMSGMLGRAPLMFHKGDVFVTVGVSEASGDIDAAKKAFATKIASRL